MSPKKPTGMPGFTIVWLGQIVSLLGTSMTGFAMTIWAYEKTGSATALALVGFFFVTPMLLVSPVAGAFVDRHNRKLMMMLSDLASGIATLIILILYASSRLEIWHLFITGALQGTFQSFQWPEKSFQVRFFCHTGQNQFLRSDKSRMPYGNHHIWNSIARMYIYFGRL